MIIFTRENIAVAMVTYKNGPFDACREMISYFIGVYIINRILHDRLEIRNLSSRVEKCLTYSLRSLMIYFSTRYKEFCISKRLCNIFYIPKGFELGTTLS